MSLFPWGISVPAVKTPGLTTKSDVIAGNHDDLKISSGIRSLLGQSCTVWNSGLTQGDSEILEPVKVPLSN